MKQFAGLILGLAVGIVGAVLFMQSLPPEEGSEEEENQRLLIELEKAARRVDALESEGKTGKPRRTLRDNMRSIAEDIRAGRRLDLDDIFDAAKPWLRDISPIFDRIRVRDQKKSFDTRIGHLTREYNLTEAQADDLADWFEEKAGANAEKFTEVVMDEKSGLEDLIRATRELDVGQDLDDHMESVLTGDDLERYRNDRLVQKVELVQAEADRKVTRLDNIVNLDEEQKDQVFGIMVRGSKHYDPSMRMEGVEGDTDTLYPGTSRDTAILRVLRPEQMNDYHQHKHQRRWEAERELREVGLSLPEDWDLFDEDDF